MPERLLEPFQGGAAVLLWAALGMLGGAAPLAAQEAPDANRPLQLQPSRQPPPRPPNAIGLPQPGARPPAAPPVPLPAEPVGALRLSAVPHEGAAPLTRGMSWRVYREAAEGTLALVAESSEAQPSLRLPAGPYYVVAAYGRATQARRVALPAGPLQESFILNAGGLRLGATVGQRRLPESRVSYTISSGPGPGGSTLIESVRGNRIVRLPVGDYYVVSRYGEANATMAGDVRVQPGRITEATLHHRAAQITLKLVSETGGEAIPNTAWSVLTPGGDTVQESIGAFPSMVLAAGDYTVIARNEGRVFSGRFTVAPGGDREVEVLAR